jgi:tyrosine-protein kinase Etk/Wzc
MRTIEQDVRSAPSSNSKDDDRFAEYPEPPRSENAILILTQLLEQKRLIFKATAISMLIGLILAFVLPVCFTADTKIMPPKQSQSALSLMMSQIGIEAGTMTDGAAGGLGLKDPNAIYLGLLKSRPVADKMIQRFNLMSVYRVNDMTDARKELEKNTLIESEKSSLISISVTDHDKSRAADMANAYTEILRDLTKSVSVSEASRRRLSFEQQLQEAKESLVTAELAFQQVQQSKGLVHLDAQSNVVIGGLASVRANIAQKEVELQTLRSYSTEHNPDVQIAEHELSAMQAQASQLEQHSSSSGFSDLGLKDIPKAGLDYLRAARELQYQQAFFDVVLKQYQAARLDEAREGAIIQVVQPAIPPDRKSSPKRAVILILFTFLGFFSGCALARWRHWYRSQLSDPALAKPLLALKSAILGSRFASLR